MIMQNFSVKKLTFTGLMAALICVLTMFPHIPNPAGSGYIHLGDGMILLAAMVVGPLAIPAAAIGSALADLFSGYALYAPATAVIKGLVALIAWLMYRRGHIVRTAVAFLAHEAEAGALHALLKAGEIPLRVTPNDTKLTNVMLDENTRQPLCVIDLDTVMPGLAAHDYGDAIRFGASTAAEDEPDLSKVEMSLEMYEAFTEGFLGACGDRLTEKEIETLPLGAKLMTLECGVRFLTDYLNGDTYFAISRPDQNLDRARTQLKLVEDMEKKWDEMNAVIAKLRK